MKRTITCMLLAACCGGVMAQSSVKTNKVKAKKENRQQKPKQMADMNTFVNELMGRMTLQEKIGQLNLLPGGDITTGAVLNSPLAQLAAKGQLGSVLNVKGQDKIRELQRAADEESRLGILLIIGQDVIHGNQTVFPIPLAQACSWNLDAITRAAHISAIEATAQGINWTYSPMVDISVDPRWGRVAEGAGEDPWLGCRIAEAVVKGYQGDGNLSGSTANDIYDTDRMMACVKHFALYGAAESGRDYNTVDMSRVRMFNQYLAPYRAAIQAGVGSVMSSFNVVDGVPATCNRWLLTSLLRDAWKFDGFVVTDYESITEAGIHGLGSKPHNAAQALHAGTDMDMCSSAYVDHLEQMLREGKVSEAEIDQACRRILEAKYKLGLFHNPYRHCEKKRLTTDLYNEQHRQAARELAAESFVLLKNQGGLLPLTKQGTIALIGPLADNRSNLVGCWSTGDTPDRYATLKESMEKALQGKAKLIYAQGCNICASETLQEAATFGRPIPRVDDAQARQEALALAAQADVVVCAMGEMAEMSGESSSRTDLELPDVQLALLRDLVATGKPVVLLNFAGRPTVMEWESAHVPSILQVWFGGSETGDAICDILFGDKAPSGRLVMTMPRNVGQIPIYYNHLNTGRPVKEGADKYYKYRSNYLDQRNDPLYPFGYGLSYTTFTYSDISVTGNRVEVTVTNTGRREGTEVVQLYIRDHEASIVRPVKELKGFNRITLKAGESQTVGFDITREMLTFYDGEGTPIYELGEFTIMIGSNSSDAALKKMKMTL